MMLEFFVPGVPVPGGSKKAFRNKYTGKIVVTDDAKGNKAWKDLVTGCGAIARRKVGDAWDGPFFAALRVEVVFHMPEPKGHTRLFHTVKPDATKLWRSTEDGLTGVLWKDDAQIVEQNVRKRYAERTGAEIRIISLS